MSKSKSRQPSKATSGAKQASTANKPPLKSSERVSAATAERQAKEIPATPTSGKALTRDAAKYERRQAERQMRYLAAKRARRNRIIAWTSGVLAVLIIGSIATYFIYQAHQPANANAANAAPYQEAVFDSTYPPVDNVYCDQLEQTVEHNHVLLTIYIDGQEYPVPANIGIPTNSSSGQPTCYYWLHVHPQNQNVIHMESPSTEPFTLHQFIDEWNQQFNSLGFPSQLLLDKGWTIWINGQKYNGDLNSVPLNEHTMITIAYGSTSGIKPVTTYNWSGL
jgi:hypothetical protein